MRSFTCIIVDDEPLAREVLINYINKIPYLNLKASYDNAWSLKEHIEKNTVDIVFLDIQMPELDGLTFMRSLSIKPEVVFVTAYREYAVDAFEVSASDYLLKPVSFDRFLQAVNKVCTEERKPEKAEKDKAYLFVLSDRKMVKVNFVDILYLEAQGDYVKIFVQNSAPILTKKTFQEIREELASNNFKQIHRSFIVNTEKIEAYTQEQVKIADQWLKISRSFKGEINF